MKRIQWTSIIAVMIISLATGCLRVKDSPAPGCVRYIGLAPIGGCFGKTIITNVEITPTIACLTIEPNNCNGGVLDVVNQCDETLKLGDVEVLPGDRTVLDLVRDGDSVRLVSAASNFSEYTPEDEQTYEFSGILGTEEVTLSFTKTGPLCD